jgi:hypothetical protein
MIITLLAAVRFSPRLPHFKLHSSTRVFLSSRSLFKLAGEVKLSALEERLDKVEHGRELREDDHLMLWCLLFEDAEKLADLRGGNEV